MMIERPFEQFREIFRHSNNLNRDLFKYIFEKSDNISLWIIGLSVGGISIFANNIADIQSVISPFSLKPILLLLTISVTSGIVYRSLYLYFFVLLNNIYIGIDLAFSNRKTMDTVSNLTGNESFEELIDRVLCGTGVDLSYLISAYKDIDDSSREIIYNSVVDYYIKMVEFAQKDIDLALDFVADTYSKFYGKNKEKFLIKIKTSNFGSKQYKTTLILTTLFYFIYNLSFLAALFLFVYAS